MELVYDNIKPKTLRHSYEIVSFSKGELFGSNFDWDVSNSFVVFLSPFKQIVPRLNQNRLLPNHHLSIHFTLYSLATESVFKCHVNK
jgi:hypothetical protein